MSVAHCREAHTVCLHDRAMTQIPPEHLTCIETHHLPQSHLAAPGGLKIARLLKEFMSTDPVIYLSESILRAVQTNK